jgi:hypothetical protein
MKVRQIYTVIREYETKDSREEVEQHAVFVQDEAGEFLYGGGSGEESISVVTMVKPQNRKEWSQL